MRNKAIFSILTFTLILPFLVEAKKSNRYLLNKPECTLKRQTQLEIEMNNTLPLGAHSAYRFPESMSELQGYCKELSSITEKAEKFFAECYHKTVKDLVKVFIYTSKQNLKKHCNVKKQSTIVKELLQHAPCANKHIRPDPLARQCLDRFVDKAKQLVNVKEDNKKTPHFCCLAVEFQQCTKEYFESIPCLRDAVPRIRQLVNGETGSMVNSACGDYNDQTNACERLGPAPRPVKRNNKTYITPVSLFIDLLESMKFD